MGEMLILRQIKSLEKVCRPIGGLFSSTVFTNLLRSGQHWVRGQTLGQGMNIVSKGKYWVRDWTLGWSSNIGLGGKYWVWGKHWVRERTLGQGANIGLEGKHWARGGVKHWVRGQTLGPGMNIGMRGKHWVGPHGWHLILKDTSRWSQPIESYEKALIANRLACSKETLWQLNEKAPYPDT